MMLPISEPEFNLYALSLPKGLDFGPLIPVSGWKTTGGSSVGALMFDPDSQKFGFIVLRRRTDHRFVLTCIKSDFLNESDAMAELTAALRPGQPAETIPPGAKKRIPLVQTGDRRIGDSFKLLTSDVKHFPALMAIGEVYLAMPNPDDNFVSDFRTENFNSRLFELYLLAALREQGVSVSQDHVSPDFFIERAGHSCYIEAVTTNPKGATVQGTTTSPTFAPVKREERLLGPAAVRFAKTLHSKVQREYERLPHVHGKSFVLAIADFHAPSSMVWSREALPSYLYGMNSQVIDAPEGRRAVASPVNTLLGEDHIPAGLFRDPGMAHLSGIISSNAVTLGKFNRMGFLAGWRPQGLSMIREGIIFDRTPGALEPIPFALNILSDEYQDLINGGETWCQELEVYHNPLAANPIDFDLLPGATHWFEVNGEIRCSSVWKNSVLSSVTYVIAQK